MIFLIIYLLSCGLAGWIMLSYNWSGPKSIQDWMIWTLVTFLWPVFVAWLCVLIGLEHNTVYKKWDSKDRNE